MEEPKITWLVKASDENYFAPTQDKFLGTHTPNDPLEISVQLWNNRLGAKDVEDLKNFTISLRFQNEEDSSLLRYCSAQAANGEKIELHHLGSHSVLKISPDFVLSGAANNGVTSENKDNFLEFTLIFQSPTGAQIKENDLKSLILEVISQ